MGISRIHGQRNTRMGMLIVLSVFSVLLALGGFPSAAGAVYYPPAERSVTWQGNTGVQGDIPNRTVVYKTLGPSGGDDTSAIQTAINSCPAGQVVQLTAGTFNVSKIDMKSNTTLRGAGIGATTLKGASTTSNYIISFGTNYNSLGTSFNLAGGYTKGSTTITTATNHGWQAGDIILIDQLQNPTGDPPISNVGSNGTSTWSSRSSGTRPVGQVVKLTAASGNTATLEIPLYWSFDPNFSPQATKFSSWVQFAGVEKLKIDNSTSMNSNQQSYGTIVFNGGANCWVLGVEVYGVWKAGIMMETAYRNTIRSSSVHFTHAYVADAGYATYAIWASSANLIEDCVFYDLANGPVLAGPSSGNVMAYNYSTKMISSEYPNTLRMGLQNNHGAHPMMNLFEGNYMEGCYITADNIWGSSSHNTWFRNRVYSNAPVTAGYTKQMIDMAIWVNQTYYNVIGNVLGNAGFENYYQQPIIPYDANKKYVFVLGASSGTSGTYGLETSTLIRHGNWDGYDNAVVWDPTISDHALPASLYLTGRPSWWTAGQPQVLPWPAIGPDLSPMSSSIPAKRRYEAPVLNP